MAALLQSHGVPAAAAAPVPEIFLVLNLGSGHADKDEVRRTLAAELDASGRAWRLVPVAPGELGAACREAARLAREHDGIFVAAGGDGTLNAAAQAALLHDCPLGVIAQGTFNLFAREHGLPLEPAAAMRAILRGRAEPVQVGLVNQRPFLVNASVGLYPKLLADREAAKQKLGRRRWIAMLAALKSTLEWRWQLRLDAEADGVTGVLSTPSIFVGNNPLQLERVGVEGQVVQPVGRGRLAVMVLRPLDLAGKWRLLWRALRSRLDEAREVDSLALRSLTVSEPHARRLRVATDGEVHWVDLPLRFAVSPKALRLVLPPADLRQPRA